MNNLIITFLSGSTLLLAFLILANPNKVNIKGNKWFGIFCICIFFILLEETLIIIDLELKNEFLLQLINIPSFTIAPVFYLSICHFINPNKQFGKKDLFHFSFGIVYLILILLTFLLPSITEIESVKNLNPAPILNIASILFLFLFCLQLILYSYYSYKKLISHQKNIRLFSSNTEEIDLKWLEYIVKSISVLSIIWAIDILFNITKSSFSIIYFILLIGIFIIAYYSLKQKEIFPFTPNEKFQIVKLIETNFNIQNEKKKLISDEDLEENKNKLLHLLQVNKIYLDSELSLVKLASIMNISTHILSYIINSGFNENFYQLINRFRIEKAKILILDPKMNHLSILGIGFEVGFNSKTVFNTTFKKATGFTPSEYKKLNYK